MDIYRITMSEEMAHGRLGNDYDKPIARRIEEEVGKVPGEAFKKAVATEFTVSVDPTLRERYFAFLEHREIIPPSSRQENSIFIQ